MADDELRALERELATSGTDDARRRLAAALARSGRRDEAISVLRPAIRRTFQRGEEWLAFLAASADLWRAYLALDPWRWPNARGGEDGVRSVPGPEGERLRWSFDPPRSGESSHDETSAELDAQGPWGDPPDEVLLDLRLAWLPRAAQILFPPSWPLRYDRAEIGERLARGEIATMRARIDLARDMARRGHAAEALSVLAPAVEEGPWNYDVGESTGMALDSTLSATYRWLGGDPAPLVARRSAPRTVLPPPPPPPPDETDRRVAATDFTDFGASDFGVTIPPSPRKTCSEHLADLRNGSNVDRTYAAVALQGFTTAPVISALIEACGDDDSSVRRVALDSLGSIVLHDLDGSGYWGWETRLGSLRNLIVESPLRAVRRDARDELGRIVARAGAGETPEALGLLYRAVREGDLGRVFLSSCPPKEARWSEDVDLEALGRLEGWDRLWAEERLLSYLPGDFRMARALASMKSRRALEPLRELRYTATGRLRDEVEAAIARLEAEP